MNNLIAIHQRTGSFSDQWIEYCEQENIPYKIVDCYENDIIEQLDDCESLMWHFHHTHPKDILFAKQLMFAVEQTGMKTFPDFNTMWHFDDKVGQKYLFESLDAPLVNTYVFYDKQKALEWAKSTVFPKVFKLRGGSGSSNVQLVHSAKEARKRIIKAFGKGYKQRDPISDIKERYRKFKNGKESIKYFLAGFYRLFKNHEYEKVKGRDRGYIYFQDFIPENNFDIRVIVIDRKAFAVKRMVRENDFRASGSGVLKYDKKLFSDEIIRLAQTYASKLNMKSFAVDFVIQNNEPLIVEISYGFPNKNFIDGCKGYWDQDLKFHTGVFNPYEWMVKSVLNTG
ncbi:MAG: hypothetical protein WD512_14620 [Candidatus Paceibacterota bacterium]